MPTNLLPLDALSKTRVLLIAWFWKPFRSPLAISVSLIAVEGTHGYIEPRDITYIDHDGIVIKDKGDPPPPPGSVTRSQARFDSHTNNNPLIAHLHLPKRPSHLSPLQDVKTATASKPNGHGPTNTIKKAVLAGILVALQQGHTETAFDGALGPDSDAHGDPPTCRTHPGHLKRDRTLLQPTNLYKVKAHYDIIGKEEADACARTAALTDNTDIALPDARDPFHNSYCQWLSLKPTHGLVVGLRSDPHHFPSALIQLPHNLTCKLKIHMHKKKLGSADSSGYYYNRQRLNHARQPAPPSITANTEAHNLPFQLANKEISNSFWNNPKITLKHHIYMLRYRALRNYAKKTCQ
eukprot:1149720-Pelagomonas_calceolata.AAC.1